MERYKSREFDEQGYCIVHGALPLETLMSCAPRVVQVAPKKKSPPTRTTSTKRFEPAHLGAAEQGSDLRRTGAERSDPHLMFHALGPGFLLSERQRQHRRPAASDVPTLRTDYVPRRFRPTR